MITQVPVVRHVIRDYQNLSVMQIVMTMIVCDEMSQIVRLVYYHDDDPSIIEYQSRPIKTLRSHVDELVRVRQERVRTASWMERLRIRIVLSFR